jgi:hypothetical protein
MQADEAAGMMDSETEADQMKRRAAVVIACFAMLLAVASLGGNNATKDALNSNILASNYMNFFQAKNMRQTSFVLAADQIELAWINDPALPAATKAALERKLDDYKRTIARYESDPATGEGKSELLAKAREYEKKRDRALKQDPYFDYASALMQIAIVLISVAIVAGRRWLAWAGSAVGVAGALLMVNGFCLVVEIPFLA